MSKYTIKNKKYLLLFIGLFCALVARSQSVVVDATIDSLQILIGEQTKIKLEASFDANQKALFPIYNSRDTIVKGVEVIEVSKPDTTYLNERKRLLVSQTYTITSFDSALYYIPPFEISVDEQPYYSKPLALKVYSVPVDTLNPDMFFLQKPVMRPPFAWEDWATAIWLSILAIPLLLLLIYLIMRFNDSKLIIKKVKVEAKLPPHEFAMNEIERIKAEKIWQKEGYAKEYYTDLTDIIRTYIQDRFGFNALEMTSSEIIDKLREISDKESIKELCDLFQTADLVKFAKHTPLMNENDMNLINAVEFINHTKTEEIITKSVPTEVTVEEKRSKRSKAIILGCIILLGVSICGILVYVGMEIFNSIY